MTQPTTQTAHSSAPAPSRKDVWRMFDRIAHRYDLLNRLLSMRQDVIWRKKMARRLPDRDQLRLLDLATGTGDQILSLLDNSNRISEAVGVDMSEEMLACGRPKMEARGLGSTVTLQRGDATDLALPDNHFDVVTISFGIRNVIDVDAALREMYRVLKPGGRVLILEFGLPSNWLVRNGYLFYFRHVLPTLGGLISGDNYAYRYLNQTVETFPYGPDFCDLMTTAGFEKVSYQPLTFGVAMLYQGDKR